MQFKVIKKESRCLKLGEGFTNNNFWSSIFMQEFMRHLQSPLLKQKKQENPAEKDTCSPLFTARCKKWCLSGPQPCLEGESNEAISGGRSQSLAGGAVTNLGDGSATQQPFFFFGLFVYRAHCQNYCERKERKGWTFLIPGEFTDSPGDGLLFLCCVVLLLWVDCGPTACICQTREKLNLQNFGGPLWGKKKEKESTNILLKAC